MISLVSRTLASVSLLWERAGFTSVKLSAMVKRAIKQRARPMWDLTSELHKDEYDIEF